MDVAQIDTLDLFDNRHPSPSNAADLFQGQWLSNIPGYGYGNAVLFDDSRIRWMEERCGGFAGKKVLELGPLEGGHTYMMASRGADVLAIESNSRAFLRCLVAREMLGYSAKFLLGDFISYLEDAPPEYDFMLCSGVLYHMTEPLRLLRSVGRSARSVGIWTHVYERSLIEANERTADHFESSPEIVEFMGRPLELWPQSYKEALDRPDYAGGPKQGSSWMTKETLLTALGLMGFRVTVGQEYLDHPHGPAILLHAER